MKKYIAFAAMFTLIIAAAYFSSCKDKKSEPTAGDNKEDSLKKVIERGDYLANHVAACIHCHSKRDFSQYSGPVTPGTEGPSPPEQKAGEEMFSVTKYWMLFPVFFMERT